ncbi:hypothetical protein M2137_002937 [Parabacteroides sp. PFB2-10]|nr:hypothetical protein [Parabacteroides sp. PFB2-10]
MLFFEKVLHIIKKVKELERAKKEWMVVAATRLFTFDVYIS